MFLIDEILVDERVASTPFLCNTDACKGACCTVPGKHGAPLDKREISAIKSVVPFVEHMLPERSLHHIKKHGAVLASEGEFYTAVVDEKDCVFVTYDGGVAKCSIELAWQKGKIPFRKPVSCHLFPLRVGQFGGEYLNFEPFSPCGSAVEHGYQHGVYAYQMLREALTRVYGEDWYARFAEACEKAYPAAEQSDGGTQ